MTSTRCTFAHFLAAMVLCVSDTACSRTSPHEPVAQVAAAHQVTVRPGQDIGTAVDGAVAATGTVAPPLPPGFVYSLCEPGCAPERPTIHSRVSRHVACLTMNSASTGPHSPRRTSVGVACRETPVEPFFSHELLPRLGWARAGAVERKSLATMWIDDYPEFDRVVSTGSRHFERAGKVFHPLQAESRTDGAVVARLWRSSDSPVTFGRPNVIRTLQRVEVQFAVDGTVSHSVLDQFSYDETAAAKEDEVAKLLAAAKLKRLLVVEMGEFEGGEAALRSALSRQLQPLKRSLMECYLEAPEWRGSDAFVIELYVEPDGHVLVFSRKFPGCMKGIHSLSIGSREGAPLERVRLTTQVRVWTR